MSKAKVVTLDIETAPLEVWAWGLWDQNIGLEQIKLDWSILSFSYKWLGDDKTFFVGTGGRGASKVRDDRDVVAALWAVLDAADIVVTQNGIAFDIPRARARMIQLGMPPYSPIKQVDTLREAKRGFVFTSNKLAHTSRILTDEPKDEHKKFPGFELWSECLKDNPEAWREMEKYNKKDVRATEKLYLKLRPWIEGHPNLAVYDANTHGLTCPKCGSGHVQLRGLAKTQVGVYHQVHCQNCGGWSRTRKMLNREQQDHLLSN